MRVGLEQLLVSLLQASDEMTWNLNEDLLDDNEEEMTGM